MEHFPLKRYFVELLGFSEEEVENLTYKWGNNFQLFRDNTLHYVGEYIHPSPVVCMITVLSSFPGFRQMEPLIEKLAHDGYDFNEAVTTGDYCNMTKQKYRYMLVILQLNPIQPFGLDILNMMVQNGLSFSTTMLARTGMSWSCCGTWFARAIRVRWKTILSTFIASAQCSR